MVKLNINVPEDFYKEEERNGFLISEEKKKVWAVELDLLNELLLVCEQLHINCYADAGTLLGAVRHKGFIPWDDDIDVAMFREDYDKLCAVAEQKFKAPYFFQTVQTDKEYFRGHAQFRNSETTAILEVEKKQEYRFNQGIFIDIFVLDAVSEKHIVRWLQNQVSSFLFKLMISLHMNRKKRRFLVNILCDICKLLHISGKTVDRWYHACFRRFGVKKHRYVAPLSFIYETKKRIRDKYFYDETVMLPFEFMEIPAPAGYDGYLSGRYGEYQKPAQIPTTHGDVFFDTEKSYLNYIDNSEDKRNEE